MPRRIALFAGLLYAALAAPVLAQVPYEPPGRTAPQPPAQLPDVAGAVAAPIPTSAPGEPAAYPVQQTVALTPPEARAMPKLPLPAAQRSDDGASRSGGGIATILGALGIVIGLFLGVAALLRRGGNKPARVLPPEAVEILGRLPLPGRQQGHLIRVGNKIALVSFGSSTAETLVEITDPLEVDRLAGLCRRDDPHGTTTSFRGVVEQFFREKPSAVQGVTTTEDADD